MICKGEGAATETESGVPTAGGITGSNGIPDAVHVRNFISVYLISFMKSAHNIKSLYTL